MREAVEVERTPRPVRVRLTVMMFLQYFVQGSYLPIISVYLQDALGFDSDQLSLFMSALAIGPLLAPFIIGQVVDRFLPTERVLAFCHFVGGILMLALYGQQYFWPVVVLGTLYSILYIPTMMLTNALTFAHLRQRDREFPGIRLWGTIGFIVPAWLIEPVFLRGLTGAELNSARGIALLFSGAAEIALALYCLTLPHTPPKPEARTRFAPGAVLGLLRRRDFQVLVAACFLVSIAHNFYFLWNSPFLKWFLGSQGIQGAYEQRISSLGQISEIGVMAGLGLAIPRFGFKKVLSVGILAYLSRCLVFAAIPVLGWPYAPAMTLVCLGQALHGFCFGCFLATGFIYVDRMAPADVRGSMQTFFGTFVFGVGSIVGARVGGIVGRAYTVGSGEAAVRDWTAIWLAPALLMAATLLAFWAFFPRRLPEQED